MTTSVNGGVLHCGMSKFQLVNLAAQKEPSRVNSDAMLSMNFIQLFFIQKNEKKTKEKE